MKLNLDFTREGTPAVSDRLAPQAAQYLGQLMQLFGLASVEFSVKGRGHTPSNISTTPFQDCPKQVSEAGEAVAFWMAGLMRELGLTKLSYEYTKADAGQIRPVWDKACEGVRSEELLVAPDVTPDMEKVEIDL